MGELSTRFSWCCERAEIGDNLDVTMACQTDLFQFDMFSFVSVIWAHRSSTKLTLSNLFLLLSNLNQTIATSAKQQQQIKTYTRCIKIHWQKHELRGNHFVQYLQNILANGCYRFYRLHKIREKHTHTRKKIAYIICSNVYVCARYNTRIHYEYTYFLHPYHFFLLSHTPFFLDFFISPGIRIQKRNMPQMDFLPFSLSHSFLALCVLWPLVNSKDGNFGGS